MPDNIFSDETDALLLPFLSAESECAAEDCLNQLFEKAVIPQICRILSSSPTLSTLDKNEIQSDTQTRVLGKLQSLRQSVRAENADAPPVRNLAAYISTVTGNCRKDFILSQKPEWRRTANRLARLQDETDSNWYFFTDGEGQKVIGFKDRTAEQNRIEIEEIVWRIRKRYPNHLFLKIQALVPIILKMAGGALPKNNLIKAILEITEPVKFEEIEMTGEWHEHFKTDKNNELVTRRQEEYLRRIWDEIKTFPANQRKVLLLSLKESRGVEAVSLLLKKRIATIREIAETLEVSLETFSEIFAKLPLTSSEIAGCLGIKDGEKTSKEQKVDNLRRIARDLLRRRLGIKK